MDKPKLEKGNFSVMRFCCRDGLCYKCHSRGNHGNRSKREKIVHTYNVSKDWADYVAANWQDYEAYVVEQP